MRDISRQTRAGRRRFEREQQVAEPETQLPGLAAERDARERAEAAQRRMSFLARASEELASSLDYETTLRTIARLAVPDIADFCAIDLADPERVVRRLVVEHQDPDKLELVRRLMERYPADPDDPHGVPAVVRTGQPEFVSEMSDEGLVAFARDAEHLRLLRSLELRSLIVAPLLARGRVLGALSVAYAESRRKYGQDDVELVVDLGRRAAMAIDNAELMRDLEEARANLEEQARQLELSNQQLAAKAAEAAAAVREREDVIAIVSHDLRNPLQTVAMASALLADERLPSDKREAQANIVRRAVEQMEVLIGDLVEATRITSGKLRVEPQPSDPGTLLREAVDLNAAVAAAKTVTIELSLNVELPPVQADPPHVLRVFSNLLANAVRFSPPGEQIVLAATAAEQEVCFSIEDHGPGIDPDHLPYIFDRFWQAKRSGRGGAGLGLAIAKGIVEAHGGHIWVDSRPGAGSVFRFTLPRAPGEDRETR